MDQCWCEGKGCDACTGEEREEINDTWEDITSEPEELTVDLQIANTLCEAEDEKAKNPAKALQVFQRIPELAKGQNLGNEAQTHVFTALQNIVLILFSLKKEQEALKAYKELLAYFSNVSQNERDGAVDSILNQTTSTVSEQLRGQLYDMIYGEVKKLSDKGSMLFTLQLRQCYEWAAKGKYKDSLKSLENLHKSCRLNDGRDDQKNKGSELTEIYALRLKIAVKTNDRVKMKELYECTKNLTCPVKNPKSQSILRECWGKMFGDQGQWARAYTEFFSAFLCYQECGDSESAKQCLKYLLVANMVGKGTTNPMAARELRVYARDPAITPIVQLREAYEKRDVETFGKCLKDFYQTADDYIQSHMNSTLNEFQRLTAVKILKSYKRIHMSELAVKLQISLEDTEKLLMQLILDGHLNGKMDQVRGILDLSRTCSGDLEKYNSLEIWSGYLETQQKNLIQPTSSSQMVW